MKPQQVRLGFGTMMLMLLTVVGAGIGLLLYYAFRVPAITTELNAWFGRPDTVVDRGDARRAQLTFALFVYTAPLALGIFVYGVHFVVNLINRNARVEQDNDEPFRME